jgi:hypothetical protein
MDTKTFTAILIGCGLVAGVAIGGTVIGEGEEILDKEAIVEEVKTEVVEELKPIEEEKEPIISFQTKDSTLIATKSQIIEAVQNDDVFKEQVAEAFVKEDGELDGEKILNDRDIFNAVLAEKIKDNGGTITVENGDINQAVLNLLTK